MTISRRALLRLAGPALALPVSLRNGRAQGFPTRPIHWIVPFPAGGPSDILARLIGQALSARLRQPVIIENLVGANGNVGTQAVINAPAD
jgi:tripartite-type tricarboxylate transporter receptor subunit TctC